MTLNKLSVLLGDKDRKDKKKSDIFLSGMVNSMPNYKNYMAIKKEMKNIISRENNDYEYK